MNQLQLFNFSFEEVAPSSDEILDFLQSGDLEEEHPAVIFIREIKNNLDFKEGISGGFILERVQDIDIKSGTLKIGNMELNPGRQICGYIKEAEQVALFLCTAGHYFTHATNHLNGKGDIMEAYILDAIGSLTVEKAMDKIQKQLKNEMSLNGLKISNRYSPGYCNWDLSEQKKIFSLIGNNPVNITLNESCLMSPTKSISGIIGIGKKLKHHKYGCEICNNSTCIYRKILHENQ